MNVYSPTETDEPFHAVEAEQALLGAALHNNQVLALLRDKIGPEHFYEHLHARLWEAMLEEVDAGRNACFFTLAPRFREDATLQAIGGVQYIVSLERNVVTVVNAPGYAEKIMDAYRVRRGRELADELTEAVDSQDPALVADVRKSLSDVFDGSTRQTAVRRHIADVADAVVTDLNDIYMSGVVPDVGASCGLPTLTRNIGSWKRGCFYVLAGRPSMGKTTVGESFMLKTAVKHNVLFFSLEMSKEQLTRRALCDISYEPQRGIQYERLENLEPGELTADQIERLVIAQRQLAARKLQIDDRAGLKSDQIRAVAAREKQRLELMGERLDVVCIDHMGIMGVSDRYKGNPVNELGEISAALKVMAKELDCAVVALMQLNRSVESRDNKRPSLSDIRGSGAIEQDADVVMFVYRESYYLERQRSDDPLDEEKREEKLRKVRNTIEIDIAKNRHGACSQMLFYCDMGSSAVRELAIDDGRR